MTPQDRVREALSFIPADDRDGWVRMAMAVKSELGDAGFGIWDEWSQSDDSYNSHDARSVWNSIKEGGAVTIGTLYHAAKVNGWRDQHERNGVDTEQKQRVATDRRHHEEAAIAAEKADTAKKAAAIWKAAEAATSDHPYLKLKRVAAVSTLRQIEASAAAALLGYTPKSSGEPLSGMLLVVPVKQGDSISTLELIDGAKRKTALAGRGTKAGGYWAAGPLPDGDGTGATVLIAEGVATALSAKEATGHHAIASLSAGNLPAVTGIVRARYPKASLIVLADLAKSTGNPDRHAEEAAVAHGARLAVPNFGNDRPHDATDFNDMAVLFGLEAVKHAIDELSYPKELPGPAQATVQLTRGSDITPEPVLWLWDGWVAQGKLAVLGGAPGTGKTTICMALAATVTIGGRWPDGSRSPVGNVVIWSGEDDPADTLVPRLTAAGAALSRVYFVSAVNEAGSSRPFDPARDIDVLRQKLSEVGDVLLVLVDPIVMAVAGDSHKNAEVRRSLQPLADLAASLRCAMVGITHFTKGTAGRDPVERLTGSLAFGALARVVLIAAKHQEEGEDGGVTRLLCRAKSNIGPDGGGFEYDLQQVELQSHPGLHASCVLWGAPMEGQARELLATADSVDDDGEGGTRADAMRFLGAMLADGPVTAKALRKEADEAGYSWATVRRAQKSLGIEAYKDGMRGPWLWKLPPRREEPEPPKVLKNSEDAQQNLLSAFGKSEHLRDMGGAVEVEV